MRSSGILPEPKISKCSGGSDSETGDPFTMKQGAKELEGVETKPIAKYLLYKQRPGGRISLKLILLVIT